MPTRQFSRYGTLTFIICVNLSSFGCGGGSSSTPPINVSVSPTSVSLQTGQTTSLTAAVTNDTANRGVTWTVSCSAAPCGSVSPTTSSSGTAVTYTSPATAPAGDLKVTVTATSTTDSSKSAFSSVTVTAIGVSVAPTTATVQAGAMFQFSATVSSDVANAGVTWTVTCSSATCGTVSPTSSASGDLVTYTAPASPPAANLGVTMTATSITDKTKSFSATITVLSVAVTVTPAVATVLEGATAQFTATLLGDSSNKGVNWTVTCAATECGSISPTSTASGVATTYTAPSLPGSDLDITITATSVANSQAAMSAAVTVPAITVTVDPSGPKVVATTTQRFTATVANDPNNKGVTWTLSCSTNACGTISATTSASGVAITYTAPALSSSDLTVTLTATSVTDTTMSSPATITVPAIVVQPISPATGIIPIKATQQFTAAVLYDPTNGGVTWTLAQNATNCSPGCGTVSPATTASGTPTTFTAPASLPASASVTLNATSIADSSKSATAEITLTNGTVQLVPANLNFTCKIRPRNFCPPPSQTIAVTQTGAAPLTINNISLTGRDVGLFHESNDCGASLNAGSSCTITVSFHPVNVGTFIASITLTDSSSDSPQNIALTGKATSVQALRLDSARAELAATSAAAVPTPTGSERVGTRVLYFTDATRQDPYLADGSRRELAMRVWYPAALEPNERCVPAEYASRAVWSYFAQLVGVRPFPVKTNSCWEAPVALGTHPVVVFSPGFTATFTDYTFLTEDLASRGYVVAAVAHTYESTAVELLDGRLAKSVFGSHLGGPMKGNGESLSTATYVRMLDLIAAVSELERLNSRDAAFAKKLDPSRIAVAGHSLGALSALLDAQVESRFTAAVLMDGFVPSALPSATKKPVLILAAGRDHWETTECHLWSNLAGPRVAVNLVGAEHVALGDWIWLTRNSVEAGPMGPEKTMSAIRDYIAAFLDAHLRGMELEPARERLLSGAATEYPDATVVRQEQALCGKP